MMQNTVHRYLNMMPTNEQVIGELLHLAQQITMAQKEGKQLGLTAEELVSYDALTKPQAIKDFYKNKELITLTKKLADTFRACLVSRHFQKKDYYKRKKEFIEMRKTYPSENSLNKYEMKKKITRPCIYDTYDIFCAILYFLKERCS